MLDLEYVQFSDSLPPFVSLTSANRLPEEDLLKAEKYLLKYFDKVLKQKCIIYKEVGKKESFCIPDFICSNESIVTIVDAKIIPANAKKMDLYQQLVRRIMDKKNDRRILNCEHLYLLMIETL